MRTAIAWARAAVALSAFVAPVPARADLPPGFQRVLVTNQLNQPTCIDFLPDGRPIIGERQGRVAIVNGDQPAAVIQIPDVATTDEYGILGMAVDPNFAVNGFIYVYYTTESGGHICRVGRFTVVNDTAAPESEAVIWQNPQNCTGNSHHGGCVRFGPDGKLYISTGEEWSPAFSQDLSSQRGKILRINADGSVPGDNPFAGNPEVDPRIWAYGLRNPWRFTFDDANGRMYIGDVGYTLWEEANLGTAGANYGWPNMEGPQCFVPDCSEYTPPQWFYGHPPGLDAAIMLGPVCRSTRFPAQYRGSLIMADFTLKWMRFLPLDESGHITGDGIEFDQGDHLYTVVDLKMGPDGALYYVLIYNGALWRMEYVGGGTPPVPMIHAAPTSIGYPPLTVRFSARGSYGLDTDPPGTLNFLWDFGDGETAEGITVEHTYTVWGRVYATVTVSDGQSAATSREVAITMGFPPQPEIDEPAEGATYRAGDVITYSGRASDIDNGFLDGQYLSWVVELVHNTHTHPFLGPVTGLGGQFTIPDSGHTPNDTAYRISMTAIDGDGITTTVKRTIHPVVSPIALATEPPGITVFVDGAPEVTPQVFESMVNFNHIISARLTAAVDGVPHRFMGWSNGAGLRFAFTSPEGGATLTAMYEPGCGADITNDGFVNGDDFDEFAVFFEIGAPDADITRDGFVNGDDFDVFTEAFGAGC